MAGELIALQPEHNRAAHGIGPDPLAHLGHALVSAGLLDGDLQVGAPGDVNLVAHPDLIEHGPIEDLAVTPAVWAGERYHRYGLVDVDNRRRYFRLDYPRVPRRALGVVCGVDVGLARRFQAHHHVVVVRRRPAGQDNGPNQCQGDQDRRSSFHVHSLWIEWTEVVSD